MKMDPLDRYRPHTHTIIKCQFWIRAWLERIRLSKVTVGHRIVIARNRPSYNVTAIDVLNLHLSKNSYSGKFQYGRMQGDGVCKYETGDIFTGNWENGIRHGWGELLNKNLILEKGYWHWGKKNGLFKIKMRGTCKVYVIYDNDILRDKAKIVWKNGSIYEGHFINNRIDGWGTCSWTSGDSYEGKWEDGKMQGWGIYKFADGKVYEGLYNNDRRCGKGHMKFQERGAFVGNWKDGKYFESGTMSWADKKSRDYTFESGQAVRIQTS
jgi:hypothetical protein